MRRTVLRLASAASSSIPAAGPGASAAGAAGTAGGATAQKMVEVELKFQPTAAVLQRAEATALEARPVRWMHDLYFDSEACVLTRADRWLRRRGHGFSGSGRGLGGKQEFELKQPAASSLPQPPHRAAVDHYEELTGAALRQALGLAAVQPPTVNEAVLQAAGLEVFAAIVTRRRTLRCAPPAELLPPRDAGAISLSIDIDDVWFARSEVALLKRGWATLGTPALCADTPHYRVAEIELMLPAGQRTAEQQRKLQLAAEKSIREFMAKELGQTEELPVRGKVLEYIKRHRPKHFKMLEDAGLITAKLGPGASPK